MKGIELDWCLSKGYFRMQQDVFTCRFVLFDDRIYTVHWLRLVLASVVYGPKQRQLLKHNERFSVTVKPFTLSAEQEDLYALYRGAINFDAPDSIENCLLDGATHNVFDTYIVEVRDAGMLIAAGVFDNGLHSIAGIMNFYHPAYRKYSLGKFLMLTKMNYAISQQKIYYYPGYLVRNYPKFDYKLFPCEKATEVFDDETGQWLPFSWETITALVT